MISVIIPVYNGDFYLEKTINSVLAQTYSDFELIVVNDGSTDKTGEIIEKSASCDNRVIHVKKEHSGLSETRNTGYMKSKGDYIIFLDGDDVIAPTAFSDMMLVKEKYNPTLVYLGAKNVTDFEIDNNIWCEIDYEKYLINLSGKEMFDGLYRPQSFSNNKGAMWGMLISREYMEKMHDEIYSDRSILPITYLEDIHMTYRFFYRAEKVSFVDYPYILHRLVDSGLSRSLRPTEYSYELMDAGTVHVKWLISHGESKNYYLYLPNYLLTLKKVWWQANRYDKNEKGKKIKSKVINSLKEHYKNIKYSKTTFSFRISIWLFKFNPHIWKLFIGDVWFLVKYKFETRKKRKKSS